MEHQIIFFQKCLKQNMNFKDVLNKAKKLGYAESNPKSDLNGDDAKSKIQILSSLAFNSLLINQNIMLKAFKTLIKLILKMQNF